MNAIAEGRVAAVVLAGGQASRLGYAQPKGVLPLGTRGLERAKKAVGAHLAGDDQRHQYVAVRLHIIAICRETKLSLDQIIVFSKKETPVFDFDGNILKTRTELATATASNPFYQTLYGINPNLFTAKMQQPKLLCHFRALSNEEKEGFAYKLKLAKLDDFAGLNTALKRALEPKLPCTDTQPISDEHCFIRSRRPSLSMNAIAEECRHLTLMGTFYENPH
ncbi:hypothetical protein niasHT_030413 [Heterodera trifolii]|uniref:MobA-like NTP transferase domain-containing protein n=1 Tax=Heterodera trifolii TaxID=157864 RepID=A0ABD2JQB2_9BILA